MLPDVLGSDALCPCVRALAADAVTFAFVSENGVALALLAAEADRGEGASSGAAIVDGGGITTEAEA